MKNLASTSLLLFVLLFVFNCHDTKEVAPESTLPSFHRNVGKKISLETAERWVNRYGKLNQSAKLETAHQVTEAMVREILDADALGASFHRGIDSFGGYHILVLPIRPGQPTWAAEYVLDANNNVLIDTQLAKAWADKYKIDNPNSVWSHFFGRFIFDDPFSRIEIIEGLNDDDEMQALLFISRYQDTSSGRTAGEVIEVFDYSAPCPNTCNP